MCKIRTITKVVGKMGWIKTEQILTEEEIEEAVRQGVQEIEKKIAQLSKR